VFNVDVRGSGCPGVFDEVTRMAAAEQSYFSFKEWTAGTPNVTIKFAELAEFANCTPPTSNQSTMTLDATTTARDVASTVRGEPLDEVDSAPFRSSVAKTRRCRCRFLLRIYSNMCGAREPARSLMLGCQPSEPPSENFEGVGFCGSEHQG
jgi:hypothetical protein